MRRPSSGDLQLLHLLWEHGELSLAEAHQQLGEDVAYTTVQTRLNRMVDKGLATRNKAGRSPIRYQAAVGPDEISATQLDTLVEKLAGGSVIPLMAQLMRSSTLSSDELGELKKLVREAERRAREASE